MGNVDHPRFRVFGLIILIVWELALVRNGSSYKVTVYQCEDNSHNIRLDCPIFNLKHLILAGF